jgi:dihydroorotase
MFDIILRGGHVIDPASGIDKVQDIAITLGQISALSNKITGEAKQVHDVSGYIVTPGLIDFHTHVYHGGAWGIDADLLGPRTCVTTFVDFGTAGPGNFQGFLDHIISHAKVRILAFLHIAYTGLDGAIYYPSALRIIGELEDIRRAIVGAAVDIGRQYDEIIRGIKVRASVEAAGSNGIQAVLLAKQAASILGKPLAVHIGEPPPTINEILQYLRPGDVLTHSFRGPINSLLDCAGKLIPEALAARERGVIFDLGHGQGSFSFHVGKQLFNQGFYPDIISSDVHAYSINGPAYDLPTTMSKFLGIGLEIKEIIRATTQMPARILGLEDSLGSLQVGREADIAVFKLERGDFLFHDVHGEELRSGTRFTPTMTFKGGRLLWMTERYKDR